MANTELIKKLNQIPENFLQSVSDYIDYILEKAKREAAEENKPTEKRGLGLGKGKAWISPDFNEPLEDMKD